jgi:carbon-monoxide dehydrogenase small subunit
MILAAYALLKEKFSPSRREILDGLSGNLCRCTGYHDILRAVNKAAKAMRKGQ